METICALLPLFLASHASSVQTVDVPFVTRTSAQHYLYVVRGYTLHLHGIAAHGVTTTFTVRMGDRTLALGDFSDEWVLDVSTKDIAQARGVLAVSYSRGRSPEVGMGRIDMEIADKSPFTVKDQGADGEHRRRIALDNGSRLAPSSVRWTCNDPAVRVVEGGADGLRVETSGALPGTYRVGAVVATPEGVSFEADGLSVQVPELVSIRPECPPSVARDRTTEGQPFAIPLRLDAHDVRSVQVLRDGSSQPGELAPDHGSFLLARKDLREGDGSWSVRAVASDGAVYLSRSRPMKVASDPAYLKHRVLLDCVAARDAILKSVSDGVGKAVEAHEAIKDAPSANEASRRWGSLDATLVDAKDAAVVPNPLGLDEKAGAGWMAGVSAIMLNWDGQLRAWIGGMAVASSPISFDASMNGIAAQCETRVGSLGRARRGLREATEEAASLDLALARLAQEAGDPAPPKAGPMLGAARLRVLDAQADRQERVLGWLDGLYSALANAKGSSSSLSASSQRVARILPPKDLKGDEGEMAVSAVAAYADMVAHRSAAQAAAEEHDAILAKYELYPGPITAEDRDRMWELRGQHEAELELASKRHREAFQLLSTALVRSGVPLVL